MKYLLTVFQLIYECLYKLVCSLGFKQHSTAYFYIYIYRDYHGEHFLKT
jgi:hypothetical protein